MSAGILQNDPAKRINYPDMTTDIRKRIEQLCAEIRRRGDVKLGI
jgi:hypothetical protein